MFLPKLPAWGEAKNKCASPDFHNPNKRYFFFAISALHFIVLSRGYQKCSEWCYKLHLIALSTGLLTFSAGHRGTRAAMASSISKTVMYQMQLTLLLLLYPSREQPKQRHGLGFLSVIYYSLLCKLDLPILSCSELHTYKSTRWSDLYFSRQYLALSTWLEGRQMLSETFQTVKPGM